MGVVELGLIIEWADLALMLVQKLQGLIGQIVKLLPFGRFLDKKSHFVYRTVPGNLSCLSR